MKHLLHSLHFQFTLLTILAFTSLGFTAHYIQQQQEKIIHFQKQIVKNEELRLLLKTQRLTKTQKKKRNDLISFYLKQENIKTSNFSTSNLKQILENINTKKSNADKVSKFHKKQSQNAKITFNGLLIFWFISFFIFLNKKWIAPIKQLQKKMNQFILGRYSYSYKLEADNEMGHLHKTFHDLAQKVLRTHNQLEQLDQTKSSFVSIASHELRTPLTSIKGSLSLLSSGIAGEMNESAQNLLTIANNESNRLIRLINELLDLAKIEAGEFPLQKEWASLYQICKTTVLSLEGLAQAVNVKLQLQVPSHDYELLMDSDRVQQVLTNLISNAIKFSPEGKSVIVSVDLNAQGQMEFYVQDSGPGIAPEDQDVIFERFSQVSSAQSPLVSGTGLGLAISKALIEEHGGSIGVRSNINKGGSIFYFTLPDIRTIEEQAS